MTILSWRLARGGLIAAAAFGAGLMTDAQPSGQFSGLPSVSQAEARIGRPATATSVAGVARRTSRRTARRVGRYY
ncbi:hypothetical protein [Methylobacterium sp. CM6257]|jgi:hypothetical protein